MPTQRVVLFDSSSQLLNELFRRFIEKEPTLQLVDEVDDPEQLAASIAEQDADWVIHLEARHRDPSEWVYPIASNHPTTRFMKVAIDNNKISMSQIRVQVDVFKKELSRKDFVAILAGKDHLLLHS